MVLTQREETCFPLLHNLCFHTTMVLTQRCSLCHSLQCGGGSFHTTMVLTQRLARLLCYETSLVSIPLWFLRNRHRRKSETNICKFPYHYGSYATYSKLINTQLNNIVSIPLWFLRNPKNRLKRKKQLEGFHTTMVLTQQEFLPVLPCTQRAFPYHYGSYATQP